MYREKRSRKGPVDRSLHFLRCKRATCSQKKNGDDSDLHNASRDSRGGNRRGKERHRRAAGAGGSGGRRRRTCGRAGAGRARACARPRTGTRSSAVLRSDERRRRSYPHVPQLPGMHITFSQEVEIGMPYGACWNEIEMRMRWED
jgi:hypothetical protein